MTKEEEELLKTKFSEETISLVKTMLLNSSKNTVTILSELLMIRDKEVKELKDEVKALKAFRWRRDQKIKNFFEID